MPQRIYQRKIYQKNRKKGIIFFFLKFSILCLLLGCLGLLGLFIYYTRDFPRPEKFTERKFVESTKIFDRTGEILLYEMYKEERREVIPLSSIPQYLKEAVIATEDANFYKHFGIDFKGILRAIQINLKIKKPLYGGSTISQQLIRSTFLTREKTIKRKIREIVLTLELERRYSKEQILEWYLNQVPFGPNIYGAEAASETYFEKPAKELSLAESAVLAALIQAPSYLSPYGERKEKLLVRKNYVLDRMAEERYITKQQAEEAKKQEIKFSESLRSIKAPHFVFYVQDYLLKKYGRDLLERGGLKVYTSLDWELQKTAEKAVFEGAERNKRYRAYNASLVSIDPKTGQILAMVGSKDWFGKPYPKGCELTPEVDCLFDPKVNVATYQIGRQPGSAFKPFVYATAFSKDENNDGISDYDDKYTVVDEPTNFGVWGGKPYAPQNYDGLFRGPVTLRQALAQSLNVPSVKVLAYLAGLEDSIETARRLGITTLTKPSSFYGLSIVLGGGEVKLLDMVSSYGVFATEGIKIAPVAILKIEDSQGNIIEETKKTPRRVLKKEAAILINDILSDNQARAPMFGSNSFMYFKNYDVAAKTGTTDNFRDAWIIGYTPSIVAGVWVGNNDNTKMSKQPGIVLAGPIWREFMNYALGKFPKKEFSPLPKSPDETSEEKNTKKNLKSKPEE